MKRRLRPEQAEERRLAAQIARAVTALMEDERVNCHEIMAYRRSWPALRWPTGRSQRKREETTATLVAIIAEAAEAAQAEEGDKLQ